MAKYGKLIKEEMVSKIQIENTFKQLQEQICLELENTDGKARFAEDSWERPGGGGGRSRVIKNGNIIEKGGVNFSAVYGETPDNILQALQLPKSQFYATGISIVLHPVNPWVPIIHMNLRYFEMSEGTWWFGGGIDLTPHFVIPEDAVKFHQKLKETCDKHSPTFYSRFKQWADDYFFIKHRNETRGIGGIFFDRLNEKEMKKEKLFAFIKETGEVFAPLYISIINKNKDKEFNEKDKQWQLLRRGRYVEFNLVYDKGTKFGLDTSGRTESILMSLPPLAGWEYDYVPKENTPEANTLSLLKKGLDWINRAATDR